MAVVRCKNEVWRQSHDVINFQTFLVLNNNIFHDIVSILIVNIGHASCTWPHKRVGLVFDENTHCFQSYNQGYRKTSNN